MRVYLLGQWMFGQLQGLGGEGEKEEGSVGWQRNEGKESVRGLLDIVF